MTNISLQSFVEASVHFGHQTQRWNPKMAPYIYGEKQGIHIINLQHTLQKLKSAYEYIRQLSEEGKEVLFIGTKLQASDIIKQYATECGSFYVSHRWLGGMLTNFATIRQSISRLEEYESLAGDDESYPSLLKKEALQIHRKRQKLEQSLGGIRNMTKFPSAIFVIDCNHEHLAISEAQKLSIPVLGIADTNSDPDDLFMMIPGNDDSIRSIRLFVETLCLAVKEGKALREERLQIEEKKASQAKSQKENVQVNAPDSPSEGKALREERLQIEEKKASQAKSQKENVQVNAPDSPSVENVPEQAKKADTKKKTEKSKKETGKADAQANTTKETDKATSQKDKKEASKAAAPADTTPEPEKTTKPMENQSDGKINAKLVKELREASGAGMMECKKALQEVGGDLEAAKEHLRKTGQAKALKKSDRETKDGGIGLSFNDSQTSAALVQIACETDFVAKNEQFLELLQTLSKHAQINGVADFADQKVSTDKTVQEILNDSIATLGENVQFLDAKQVSVEQGVIGGYLHTTGKIGVLIALATKGECDQARLSAVAKDIAMHVAATPAESISPDEINPALIEKEKEIFIAQAQESGKPPEIIEKMVAGRLKKFLNEVCVLKQPFVKNPDQTIEQLLKDTSKELGTQITLQQFAKLQF